MHEERHRRGDAPRRFVRIERTDHVAAFVFVGRRAAERREHVDREREEAFERDAPRNVLDVRIEPAVLVDDDNRWAFSLRLEPRQIAGDLGAGGVVRGRLDRKPYVIRRYYRRLGVIVLQQRQQRQRRRGGAGDVAETLEEVAAADGAVREVVVERDNVRIEVGAHCWPYETGSGGHHA